MANENYLGFGIVFIVVLLALALGAASGGFNPDGFASIIVQKTAIGQKVCGTGGNWCPSGYTCVERTPQASYGLKTARYPMYCKPTPQNKAI
ncbi:MAG: hypothetical protein HY438_00640 [DPANN group archaeon]|nr:hypothetical protein [DPANN group archaeon]